MTYLFPTTPRSPGIAQKLPCNSDLIMCNPVPPAYNPQGVPLALFSNFSDSSLLA